MTTASEIVRGVGGPENIESLTHCATRLRFQLHDGAIQGVDAVYDMGIALTAGAFLGGAVLALPLTWVAAKQIQATDPTDSLND